MGNRIFLIIFMVSTSIILTIGCGDKAGTDESRQEDWVSLFNGKDLAGWQVKIKGHEVNENFRNTFRVEDSMIRVSYADYEKFDNQFGHLFTDRPFSYYKPRKYE